LDVFEKHRKISRGERLQRLFSTFPGAWPGLGLLLLRAVVGATAIVQGFLGLTDPGVSTFGTWLAALFAIVIGTLLLIGFLTPVAGALAALDALALALSWLPAPASNLFDAKLPTVLVVVVSAAIVFLGPGAISLDARLFGRREIIIPHVTRLPED
jgi:uncharacterized membrane protein YphA (DoxX/SURF4 family)